MRDLFRRHGPALGVAAVFALLFGLLAPSILGRDLTRDHSAFRKNRWGCAALADLCRRAEPALTVDLLTRPLDDLADLEGLLAVIDPERPFAPVEVESIVRWVEGGGTLLVAVEGIWADPAGTPMGRRPAFSALTEALGVQFHELANPADRAAPSSGSVYGAGLGRVVVDTNEGVVVVPDPPNAEPTPELAAAGQPVVVAFRRGEGRVIASSDAQMFSNGTLEQEDNLQFVANLLWGNAVGGKVAFDEYHHGFGPRVRVGSIPDPAPLYRALLVAAVGIAVFLYGKAQRFGAPVQVLDARRRAPLEYVEALAGLLARGQANRWALEKVAAAFRHRLLTEAALPATVEEGALAATLAQRRGVPSETTARLLADLREALDRDAVGGRRLAELTARMSDLEDRIAARADRIRPGRGGR